MPYWTFSSFLHIVIISILLKYFVGRIIFLKHEMFDKKYLGKHNAVIYELEPILLSSLIP